MAIKQKITTFLWFDANAEDAARFYTSIFRNSRIGGITRYGEAGPGPKGGVMTVEFELEGQQLIALNCGPHFKFTEAISLMVHTDSQEETHELLGDPDPLKARRVMEAMMTMTKIDVPRLEAAAARK